MTGALDPATGMSVDLGIVDAAVKAALLDRVDHYDLSATVPELDGVITTGENLARTFWQWLEPVLPAGRLRRVAVVETDNNVFEYCGDDRPGEVTHAGAPDPRLPEGAGRRPHPGGARAHARARRQGLQVLHVRL